jgi:isoleucyl-tRNA synthetase
MPPLERYVLHRLWELDRHVRAAYENYLFQDAVRPITEFCQNELSALFFDIRRDALLATVGWQTLRFSFARMTRAPEACRRDIRAVHAARLRLIRGGAGR